MKLVVDASVAIKWYLPEEHSLTAIRLLSGEIVLSAPDLIYAEVGNTLWKKARRGELSHDGAVDIFAMFERVDLEIHPSPRIRSLALTFAMELDCSFYDSLYLALAVDQNCGVITADQRFHTAVKSSPLAHHVRWIGEDR
ncbi:MAG TPA: type II toxin-antitoxin system VapC family toxin [Thermoanaerobaculia bacterium]|jgi:predicted nucleic acid-binding protein|nr:type II toxin-antitoxin system VapC family toxin [Thermoanaerobaculia bacterium]